MSTRIRSLLWMTLSVVLLSFATERQAAAYADPGTGAFIYQSAYALFLGGAFYLRRFLDRVWRKRR